MASGSVDQQQKDKDLRWYLTVEQLQNSPSRQSGIDVDQELKHRQLAAYLIQDMGQRLRVSQLCINTAIVYMHRFYAFHSFTNFHRNSIASASLFLAAKVEEQPRKLDSVIQTSHACLNIEMPADASKDASYQEQAQDLVFNENVLLQTLGFDVAVDHPHTHVVKTCHLVKACKDLAQTSYFLASNSLHLTTMCLQYRPTVVACFCIYLACKWSRWEIPQSTEGKHWFHYVDKTVTLELLEQLTNEFLVIYEKSPARLKSKLNSIKPLGMPAKSNDSSSSQRPPQLTQSSSNAESRPQHSSTSSGEHSRSSSSSHSSHHRSSSHHHKQQATISGQSGVESIPPKHISSSQQKQVQQMSAVGSSSSSSSSSRPRPERGIDRSMPQEPHFPALHRTAGSSKGPLPPLTRGNIGDNSLSQQRPPPPPQPPQQSLPSLSSSSSTITSHSLHDTNYQIPLNKSRSSMMPQQQQQQQLPQDSHRHTIKQEQRHNSGNKESKSIDSSLFKESKNLKNSAAQQQISNNMYQMPSSGGDRNSGILSQSSITTMQQQQQQRQQQQYSQPPNYTQAMANRSLPSNDHQSVHVHNKQQQQQLLQQQTLSESSYRLTEDLGRMTELPANLLQPTTGSIMNTPPKQTIKAPSIFSPEWNEKTNAITNPPPTMMTKLNNSLNVNNGLNNSSSSSSSNVKLKESPGRSKHERRVETPKKDKRNEAQLIAAQQMQQQQQQKLSIPSEKRPKKLSDSLGGNMMPMTIMPPMSQSQLVSGSFDMVSIPPPPPIMSSSSVAATNKQHGIQSSMKRAYPDDLLIKQEDGVDFRETKHRKLTMDITQPVSPSRNKMPPSLLGSSNFNVGNLSQQQQHMPMSVDNMMMMNNVDIKPNLSNIGSSSSSAAAAYSALNGIETNPDLVSSLLKESLCNDNKFTSTFNPAVTSNSMLSTASGIGNLTQQQLMQTQKPITVPIPQLFIKTESIKDEPIDQLPDIMTNVPAIDFIKSLPSPLKMETNPDGTITEQRIKSEKKKKKDKHKHKEKDKDKTKDREERKKHKKDKDRQKDRERSTATTTTSSSLQQLDVQQSSSLSNDSASIHNTAGSDVNQLQLLQQHQQLNPIKITIPKDKLNLPSSHHHDSGGNNGGGGGGIVTQQSGFKITIPKERIRTEVPPPPTSLKIKISKDKIESYSSTSGGVGGGGGGGGGTMSYIQSSGNTADTLNVGHYHAHGGGSSSSGSKKKDRDREKSKNSKNIDYNKHNGNGGSGNNGSNSNGGGGGSATNRNSSSNSSKTIHQQTQQQPTYFNSNHSQFTMPNQINLPQTFNKQQLQQQQLSFNTTSASSYQQPSLLTSSSSSMQSINNNLMSGQPQSLLPMNTHRLSSNNNNNKYSNHHSQPTYNYNYHNSGNNSNNNASKKS